MARLETFPDCQGVSPDIGQWHSQFCSRCNWEGGKAHQHVFIQSRLMLQNSLLRHQELSLKTRCIALGRAHLMSEHWIDLAHYYWGWKAIVAVYVSHQRQRQETCCRYKQILQQNKHSDWKHIHIRPWDFRVRVWLALILQDSERHCVILPEISLHKGCPAVSTLYSMFDKPLTQLQQIKGISFLPYNVMQCWWAQHQAGCPRAVSKQLLWE